MTPYLVVGGIGVALLVFSLVVGELFDGLFDAFGSDLLSGASVAAFLGTLGFVGALVFGSTQSHGWATGAGLLAGVLVGAGAGWLSSALSRDDDSSTVRSSSLAGRDATVVSAVPAEGYGEVSVVVAGHITKLNARAGTALPAGTPVTITAVLSATSVQVAPRG
jgi:membrane protein implicated in regulation of membrane protease activity